MLLSPSRWSWSQPPSPLLRRLPGLGEPPVLWLADLTEAGPLDRASAVLSTDEWDRSARFHEEADRLRFRSARLFLRELLGWLLDRSPAALRFAAGPAGKPYLAFGYGRLRPLFNLSRSADLVVIALSGSHEVGVDVEHIDPAQDWSGVAAGFLAPEVFARWQALPPVARTSEFYRAWTRHEATVKAQGIGLAGHDRNLTLGPAPSAVRHYEIALPDGYRGAAALCGRSQPFSEPLTLPRRLGRMVKAPG